MPTIDIRDSRPHDSSAIAGLYPDAFPDEDLLPLVRELLDQDTGVVSLVAMADDALAGHVVFTGCGITGSAAKAALLGPLAVATGRQRGGIGSALVRAGLERLENAGFDLAFVLGDPAYYGRFGFAPEQRITPPYPLPDEWQGAWQSLSIGEEPAPLEGQLSVPQPWRRRALWAP